MTDRLTKLRNRKKLRIAGLMSGTSCDGVDVAIADFYGDTKIKTIAFETVKYPRKLAQRIGDLCCAKSVDVNEICSLNFQVGEFFADSLLKVINKNEIKKIDLIGSHGQTVRHLSAGKKRSTLQIGEPSIIAEKTGVVTVADFRPRDIAAGGHGAPLVPYFDWKLLTHRKLNRIALNIGGIANITWLPAAGKIDEVRAFDTGPGNMVVDYVVNKLTGGRKKYDKGGKIAATGFVDVDILEQMLVDPYIKKRWPKTAGRQEFGPVFAEAYLKLAKKNKLSLEDTVSTAAAFTAMSIADAVLRVSKGTANQVIVSGGGVHNHAIMRMIERLLEDCDVYSSEDFGIDPDAKEAICFAMLARQTLFEIPSNVPAATGATKPVVLGKIVL